MNTELYDTLGVSPDASPEDIKAAHRRAVKQNHPDAGGNTDAFRAVQRAYDVLSDPKHRARYDATGSTDTMNREDRISAMAQERFGAMLIEILQSDDPFVFRRDWVAEAKRQAGKDRTRITAELKAIKAKQAQAEKLAARFKTTAPRNIPRDVLAHVGREIGRTIAQAEEKLEVLARYEQILADYEFEADKAPQTQQETLQDLMRRQFQQGQTYSSPFFKG